VTAEVASMDVECWIQKLPEEREICEKSIASILDVFSRINMAACTVVSNRCVSEI
jgi:hypothetical protein